MFSCGEALKVTIHLNEDTVSEQETLCNEIFSFLSDHGVSKATLIRPELGVSGHLSRRECGSLALERKRQPVRIEFIGTRENIGGFLASLCEFVTEGVVEAHDTMVFKAIAKPTERKQGDI
jgi:uncharacterized protein